jgi:hypothetical protein
MAVDSAADVAVVRMTTAVTPVSHANHGGRFLSTQFFLTPKQARVPFRHVVFPRVFIVPASHTSSLARAFEVPANRELAAVKGVVAGREDPSLASGFSEK